MNVDKIGTVFGVDVHRNITRAKAQEIVRAKAKRTQEISNTDGVSFARAALLSQDELLEFADKLDTDSKNVLLKFIKEEQQILAHEHIEIINKVDSKIRETNSELVDNEIKDISMWKNITWFLIIVVVFAFLVFTVK